MAIDCLRKAAIKVYMVGTWAELLNLSTLDIHRSARDLSLPPPIHLYARVLSSYLLGDTEKLAEICSTIAPDEPVRELAMQRLAFRRGKVSAKTLHELETKSFPDALEAEKYFSLGLAWESLGNDRYAMAMFMRAAEIYRRHQVFSKGLRAHFNAIAADSRVHPHKNFVAEYQAVVVEADRIGERTSSGVARSMLAREYQIVGLHEKALAMVNEALVQLELERGTQHYFLALLNKAHILLDLDRHSEIDELLKECELADFPSIRAARLLLVAALDPALTWDKNLEKDLLPTWKNRVPMLIGRREVVAGDGAASELERALLRYAYNGPVEKWDLIAKLYPGESDSEVLENRFKNLLARVRKKHPGILVCEGSRYFLAKMPAKEGTL